MKIAKAALVLLLGILLLTSFACGGGGSGQGSTPTPAPAWTTYSNSELGISIQYPQDWVKNEGQGGSTYYLAFTSPKHGDAVYSEILAIIKNQETEPVKLSDWVDTWLLVLGARADNTGFNLSESSATTIAGMPAQRLVYTKKLDQYSIKCMDIISAKNNIVYTIDFAADITTYDSDLTTAQQMIDSLVIY